MRWSEENVASVKGESSDEDDEQVQYRAPAGDAAGGGGKVMEGAGDDVEGEKLGGKGEGGRRSEYRGGDYYEFIARAPSIRWQTLPHHHHHYHSHYGEGKL